MKNQVVFCMEKMKEEINVFFLQNNTRYKSVQINDPDEIEYFIKDNPISESISGSFLLSIKEQEISSQASLFSIKLHKNLVRNYASHERYLVIDNIVQKLNTAIENANPTQIDLTDELEKIGWHFICA